MTEYLRWLWLIINSKFKRRHCSGCEKFVDENNFYHIGWVEYCGEKVIRWSVCGNCISKSRPNAKIEADRDSTMFIDRKYDDEIFTFLINRSIRRYDHILTPAEIDRFSA